METALRKQNTQPAYLAPHLTMEDVLAILKPFPEQLLLIYGNKLKSVILYGSFTRGTATDASDIDIAVIVDETDDELRKQFSALSDVTADLDLEYFRVFSSVDISYRRYQNWKNNYPFFRNIENEGIVLFGEK